MTVDDIGIATGFIVGRYMFLAECFLTYRLSDSGDKELGGKGCE